METKKNLSSISDPDKPIITICFKSRERIRRYIANIPRDFDNGFLFLNMVRSRKPLNQHYMVNWKEAMG